MGVFPSGQRGQTVNLLTMSTVVRIHPLPPKSDLRKQVAFFISSGLFDLYNAGNSAKIQAFDNVYGGHYYARCSRRL